MKKASFSKIIKLFLTFTAIILHVESKPPKLTVIFVIDQFAYHYIPKIKPHLTGGINELFKKGIFYKNAYVPHSHPSTACGHVTLATGTVPKTHGIIGNGWPTSTGKTVKYEKLGVGPEHAVFSPNGLYNYSKSAKNIMVDGLSDQFKRHNLPWRHNPPCRHNVFAISHKSRAAIGIAGKLGKAIWFDYNGRQFTSSKAYFKKLPTWIKNFNKKYMADKIPETLTWKTFYKENQPAEAQPPMYDFCNALSYKFAAHPFSLLNRPFNKIKSWIKSTCSLKNIDARKAVSHGDYSKLYIKTPHANQHLLDLAKACLEKNLTNDQFILWLSLSPLDPLGHYYGPDSKETIDLLYHLDWQIKQFMKYLHKKVPPKDILYVLTADHGVMPIIEILQKRGTASHEGMKNTHRIDEKKIIEKLNKYIKDRHNTKNVISHYANSCFYVNKKVFYNSKKETRAEIAKTVKTVLKKEPGIKEVWTFDELNKLNVEPGSIDSFFKNQIYKNRSGEFICKCHPYCTITKHAFGTHHRTPYEYDTHVPLVIYRKGVLQKKTIVEKVFTTQIASRLAKILDIPKPPASTVKPLPI
jgi:predicted AlkP superfamily pyrophosphatase or phosphodiesterase